MKESPVLGPSGVGHAYAVLKGRRTGNPEAAKRFLSSLSDGERTQRNRNDSRLHRAAKKGYKPGRHPRRTR